MSGGWEREIIEPFEALIAPRTLVWKEKYGTLRPEWLQLSNGSIEMVGDYGRVLEEASRRCCMECGRWHGWASDNQGVAEVDTAWTNGWVKTLCAQCRAADGKVETERVHEPEQKHYAFKQLLPEPPHTGQSNGGDKREVVRITAVPGAESAPLALP